MKKLLLILSFSLGIFINAQVLLDTASIKVDTIKHWSVLGKQSLIINQAAFSNWVGGGGNNVGWLVGADYNITYEKDKDLWENIILLNYGQNDTKGLGVRKTQDVINFSTNYGRKVSKSWYLSVGAGVLSQFTAGYEDGNNPAAKKISNFMAPGYLNVGMGITYRPNDNVNVTLRPSNARWVFVLDKDLQTAGTYGLKADGDDSLLQYGFLGTAYYKVKLMENVNVTNTASIFSNYLDHPERLVLAYGLILNLKVNKFISSNITVDLMYDHNQIKKTQLKQTLGVGFAYTLDNGVKRSDRKDSQWWIKK
ncbi:DUF3078 domain-containing protein [Chryseobacterium shandongense]|jgi:hypothetical protein|uniref:DUF3078 domain-containing protein n=1 Tax=Chryseobacterium shandongense TaxID=1493872 RepID=A0AAD1DLN5_9FLAO|nr:MULTISPECIES: DUF3078 domain-containing protein [Chryseobacterium]AZA87752.1 DUF3078 domain-containing protein [Chryseobacterium shandongense]AZA96251.1 DUF3078 domain-containing protein [Chryseobacterium shandongense]